MCFLNCRRSFRNSFRQIGRDQTGLGGFPNQGLVSMSRLLGICHQQISSNQPYPFWGFFLMENITKKQPYLLEWISPTLRWGYRCEVGHRNPWQSIPTAHEEWLLCNLGRLGRLHLFDLRWRTKKWFALSNRGNKTFGTLLICMGFACCTMLKLSIVQKNHAKSKKVQSKLRTLINKKWWLVSVSWKRWFHLIHGENQRKPWVESYRILHPAWT